MFTGVGQTRACLYYFMAVFQSTEQLYRVMQALFERLKAVPASIEDFTHSNLVIRIRLTAPNAEILLDGRQPPLEVFYGERPGKANLEFEMPADLLHQIWLGQESASQAFFSKRIKAKGNILKARQLMDLFGECEKVYPAVVADFNLLAD